MSLVCRHFDPSTSTGALVPPCQSRFLPIQLRGGCSGLHVFAPIHTTELHGSNLQTFDLHQVGRLDGADASLRRTISHSPPRQQRYPLRHTRMCMFPTRMENKKVIKSHCSRPSYNPNNHNHDDNTQSSLRTKTKCHTCCRDAQT
jgi:hypothetical protein